MGWRSGGKGMERGGLGCGGAVGGGVEWRGGGLMKGQTGNSTPVTRRKQHSSDNMEIVLQRRVGNNTPMKRWKWHSNETVTLEEVLQ